MAEYDAYIKELYKVIDKIENNANDSSSKKRSKKFTEPQENENTEQSSKYANTNSFEDDNALSDQAYLGAYTSSEQTEL